MTETMYLLALFVPAGGVGLVLAMFAVSRLKREQSAYMQHFAQHKTSGLRP